MSIMKISITGHTKGLGKELTTRFDDVVGFSKSNGYDISDNYDRAKIIFEIEDSDVFINNAHENFDQTKMLMEVFEKWKYMDKTIINIVSRSKYPNISKGYLYSASKSSLNHLSNSLRMISDKKCRIIDINAGLLNSDLPSLTYSELSDIIVWCINQPKHIEVGELSVWHNTPYKVVSNLKDKQK